MKFSNFSICAVGVYTEGVVGVYYISIDLYKQCWLKNNLKGALWQEIIIVPSI
jgi:hypothetical protein